MAASTWQRIWRWHFYAGVLVVPFVLVLALSGALYLFKPQVERWEERAFHGLPVAGPVTGAVAPSAQVAAALAANPGARLVFYRLPERAGDAAMVHVGLPGGEMRDVFVAPQGRVLGALDPEARVIAWDRRLHGQLLLGRKGSWAVELVASWAIVLILSGLWLAWSARGGAAGLVWPRLSRSGRPLWRDLHAVAGFWVSGLALVLLFTGLPWADAWGSAFKAVRAELGWVKGRQDWTIGGKPAPDPAADLHAEHDHAAMAHGHGGGRWQPATLDIMAAIGAARGMAFPVLVVPPGAPGGEGGTGKPATGWLLKSEAQNRPLREVWRYDAAGERALAHETFAGKHPIDRIVGYGVAWHEGALLGWVNQLVGLLTAAALVLVAVSGFAMWRSRKPAGLLGAPGAGAMPRGAGFRLAVLALAVWLPLFTASLAAVALLEWLVLRRVAPVARWLGLDPASARTG